MKTAATSVVSALVLTLTLACAKTGAEETPASQPTDAPERIEIAVTEEGYRPEKVSVPKGQPVTLVFTRKTDSTCAKEVRIDLGDGKSIEKPLPLDQPVEIPVTFAKAGPLRYACAMDMLGGVISVE